MLYVCKTWEKTTPLKISFKGGGILLLTDHVSGVTSESVNLSADDGFDRFDDRVGEQRHQNGVQREDPDHFTNIHLFIFAF